MNSNQWLLEKDASESLGVSVKALQHWREIGYLKPGTNWRTAPDNCSSPWKPTFIYHLRWCKEIIEYWHQKDAPVNDFAA